MYALIYQPPIPFSAQFVPVPDCPNRDPTFGAFLIKKRRSQATTASRQFPTDHNVQIAEGMGPNNIVFGSDSLWYGGPQWQIEAFWRSQIPDSIRQRWGYPQLNEGAKRQILGHNSAQLYGLAAATPQYVDGGLLGYPGAPALQPGGYMDNVLNGPGYPTPIVPASLLPNDRFAQYKRSADEMRQGRSNMRFGWMRTRV